MRTIHTGLALFATESFRQASLPLFEAGGVGAIEWTVDLGWTDRGVPDWTAALLDAYGDADRLYGHGVMMSPTTAQLDDVARRWLARLAAETRTRRYRHVTEHWGFSRARGLARGAPFPLIECEATFACSAGALRALAEAARVPVGLENLALAFSDAEVDAQPRMLARVLDAVDGILLLDLHNAWCQAINYGRDVRELVASYPLERVRELHVAGGGWSESAYGAPFRRDTHDALVPSEVLALVAWVVPRCPALEVVILERLPHTLEDEPARDAWRAEWRELAEVVEHAARVSLTSSRAAATSPERDACCLGDVVAYAERARGQPRGEPATSTSDGYGDVASSADTSTANHGDRGVRTTSARRGEDGSRAAFEPNDDDRARTESAGRGEGTRPTAMASDDDGNTGTTRLGGRATPAASVAELARFQEALARALLAGGAAADVHAALLAHPATAPFVDAVEAWQPRALEVAIALARKWSMDDGT